MKTKTILIIASFVIIILSGVLAYGIEQIKSENELASHMQNQAESLAEANALAQSIRTAKNKAATDLAALDAISLTQTDLVPFIGLIEETGKQMGLDTTIESVSSDPVKVSTASSTDFQPPQPIHIVIATKGNWSGSFGFIHALENVPQHITVDSVDMRVDEMQGTKTASSTRVWHTEAAITIYAFND